MKMKTQQPKPMGHCKSSANRKVHSNTSLLQETREILNRQPDFTPKATGKSKTKKSPKLVEGKQS